MLLVQTESAVVLCSPSAKELVLLYYQPKSRSKNPATMLCIQNPASRFNELLARALAAFPLISPHPTGGAAAAARSFAGAFFAASTGNTSIWGWPAFVYRFISCHRFLRSFAFSALFSTFFFRPPVSRLLWQIFLQHGLRCARRKRACTSSRHRLQTQQRGSFHSTTTKRTSERFVLGAVCCFSLAQSFPTANTARTRIRLDGRRRRTVWVLVTPFSSVRFSRYDIRFPPVPEMINFELHTFLMLSIPKLARDGLTFVVQRSLLKNRPKK